jgi:hypothetical protein
VIESIYVRDPNGYFVEFTRKLRALDTLDAEDAALTLQAALAAEEAAGAKGERLRAVDAIWSGKAALLDHAHGRASDGVGLYVPRLEEFSSLVREAAARPECRITALDGYDLIEADAAIEFTRKSLGLKPAVWYGLFTGGVRGRIEIFDRDRVVVAPHAA